MYVNAFEGWRLVCENSGWTTEGETREHALLRLTAERDLRLFEYFEVYDADQRSVFQEEASREKVLELR